MKHTQITHRSATLRRARVVDKVFVEFRRNHNCSKLEVERSYLKETFVQFEVRCRMSVGEFELFGSFWL